MRAVSCYRTDNLGTLIVFSNSAWLPDPESAKARREEARERRTRWRVRPRGKRIALAECSKSANRRPPRWQEKRNPRTINHLRSSDRQIAA